jgi:transposase InsO family protein
MLLDYKAEGMSLRNDNGSQFIANAVREYLKEKGIYQVFSHVATPQDNAYIEALHSNLQRDSNWEDAVPESTADAIVTSICPKRKAKKK